MPYALAEVFMQLVLSLPGDAAPAGRVSDRDGSGRRGPLPRGGLRG